MNHLPIVAVADSSDGDAAEKVDMTCQYYASVSVS